MLIGLVVPDLIPSDSKHNEYYKQEAPVAQPISPQEWGPFVAIVAERKASHESTAAINRLNAARKAEAAAWAGLEAYRKSERLVEGR